MALALKHIHDPNILPFLAEIMTMAQELEKHGEESYVCTIMTYVATSGNISDLNWAKTLQTLEEQDPEESMKLITAIKNTLKDENSFLAQKMKTMFFEEGIEQGEQKKALEIAKALLMQGIDIKTISKATQLSEGEIRKLLS
jgi:predicted transposase YdaD